LQDASYGGMKDGATMKRIAYVFAGVLLTSMLVTLAAAQSQPLGDYARAVRKEKKPPAAKQFDNDNLPRTDKLSVVGKVSADSGTVGGEAAGDTPAAAQNNDQSQSAAQPDDSAQKADDRQKGYDEWKKKIATQKDQVDLLTRELDVMQREYRLRAAAFYADAGNRLRSAGTWDKEDKQYKQQVAEKQKALDAAKKQLEDLKEQARKAGAPSSARQ
jgi:hypothetical protein